MCHEYSSRCNVFIIHRVIGFSVLGARFTSVYFPQPYSDLWRQLKMKRRRKSRKEPFRFQAARFSFWAPIVAIFLNIVGSSVTKESRGATIVLGIICCAIIVLGLAFAVYALLSIRKHGKRGVLGYGIAGLILNGLIVISAVAAIPAFQKIRAQTERNYVVQTVADIERECPKMIDDITRIDGVTLVDENRVSVRYTITAYAADEIDMNQWNEQTVPLLKQSIGQSIFSTFLDRGVFVEYKYFGRRGNPIDTVVFDPADYRRFN